MGEVKDDQTQILLSGKIQFNYESPVHVRFINITLVIPKWKEIKQEWCVQLITIVPYQFSMIYEHE